MPSSRLGRRLPIQSSATIDALSAGYGELLGDIIDGIRCSRVTTADWS
jgi:hypothetical protein